MYVNLQPTSGQSTSSVAGDVSYHTIRKEPAGNREEHRIFGVFGLSKDGCPLPSSRRRRATAGPCVAALGGVE